MAGTVASDDVKTSSISNDQAHDLQYAYPVWPHVTHNEFGQWTNCHSFVFASIYGFAVEFIFLLRSFLMYVDVQTATGRLWYKAVMSQALTRAASTRTLLFCGSNGNPPEVVAS